MDHSTEISYLRGYLQRVQEAAQHLGHQDLDDIIRKGEAAKRGNEAREKAHAERQKARGL